MNTFKTNDKVVCIDATPIPIGAPNNDYQDFEFPGGYLEEGAVYCVRCVAHSRNGGEALYIVGPYALLEGVYIPWNAQRFRKVKDNGQGSKKADGKQKGAVTNYQR